MDRIQMQMRLFGLVASMALCLSGCNKTSDLAASHVFSNVSFDDGRAQAKAAGKLFIVDATATWCKPCQVMEKTTWVDRRIKNWFAEHAIAIQVDVDKQKQLANDLRIEAMPTVIVFKDGKELDRVRGLQTSDQLIAWLNGLLKRT